MRPRVLARKIRTASLPEDLDSLSITSFLATQTIEWAPMAQAKSSDRDGRVIDVLPRPSMQRMAIMAGVIFLVTSLLVLVSPVGHILVAAGFFLAGLGLIVGGFYFLNSSQPILRLSKAGLYIQRFDTLFPWDTIEHATLTSTGARMGKVQRSVAAIKSVNRSEERVLLMIELTDAGRRQFKGQQFSESLLRKYMRDEESICVWLGSMDYTSAKRQFDSREEVADAINDRARKYGHADQTTAEPFDDVPLGTTSRKGSRKRKTEDSQSKSKQGVTVISTVLAVVVLAGISLGRHLLRQNVAGKNPNRNQQPAQQAPVNASINLSPIVQNGPDRQVQDGVGADAKGDSESSPGPGQSSGPAASNRAGSQFGPGQRSGPVRRSSPGPRSGPRAKFSPRPGQQTETARPDQ